MHNTLVYKSKNSVIINLNLYLQKSKHVYDMGFQRCKKENGVIVVIVKYFPITYILIYLCGKGTMWVVHVAQS